MCFSAINGSGAAYLSELLHVYTPSRTLRSSSDTRMLEIQQYKRKTHSFRTFSCFGPHICNSFPQDLRHRSTLSSFKVKLKTILFSQYFHPNISTQFLLQSVCVCVCVCVFVVRFFFMILYVNCFGRTMLHISTCSQNIIFRLRVHDKCTLLLLLLFGFALHRFVHQGQPYCHLRVNISFRSWVLLGRK